MERSVNAGTRKQNGLLDLEEVVYLMIHCGLPRTSIHSDQQTQ